MKPIETIILKRKSEREHINGLMTVMMQFRHYPEEAIKATFEVFKPSEDFGDPDEARIFRYEDQTLIAIFIDEVELDVPSDTHRLGRPTGYGMKRIKERHESTPWVLGYPTPAVNYWGWASYHDAPLPDLYEGVFYEEDVRRAERDAGWDPNP